MYPLIVIYSAGTAYGVKCTTKSGVFPTSDIRIRPKLKWTSAVSKVQDRVLSNQGTAVVDSANANLFYFQKSPCLLVYFFGEAEATYALSVVVGSLDSPLDRG